MSTLTKESSKEEETYYNKVKPPISSGKSGNTKKLQKMLKKHLTKKPSHDIIGKPFRERHKQTPENGGVLCELNNENMNKHLGQF